MSKDRNPEELAQYLDSLLQASTMPSAEDIDDPLVEVALQLAQEQPPQLSTDAHARILKKVRQAHQTTTSTPDIKPKRIISFSVQPILRWVAVFAIFIVLMNNVAVPAMADSLPGDILYPAKLVLESVELGLATSDTNRAEVYIRQAERRLDEANKLLDSNRVNEQLIVKSLDNLKRANQLQLNNTVIQSQVASTLVKVENLIERIAEVKPAVADTLSQQLLATSPTAEPTFVVEDRNQIIEPTTTATATLTPTLTFTPTLTNTPIPTATHTLTPTDTPTATPTLEPSPTYTDEPTLTPVYESYIGVVSATTYVNIRSLPTIDSEIIQQVAPGTIVTIISESIDSLWLKIEIDEELQGWIASSLIVEGTIPVFTLPSEAGLEPTTLPSSSNPPDDPADTTGSPASNQGNDDNNKFGCDGQGNSCNVGNQGNNNGNKGKGKN